MFNNERPYESLESGEYSWSRCEMIYQNAHVFKLITIGDSAVPNWEFAASSPNEMYLADMVTDYMSLLGEKISIQLSTGEVPKAAESVEGYLNLYVRCFLKSAFAVSASPNMHKIPHLALVIGWVQARKQDQPSFIYIERLAEAA